MTDLDVTDLDMRAGEACPSCDRWIYLNGLGYMPPHKDSRHIWCPGKARA